jgi:hypothetical protein
MLKPVGYNPDKNENLAQNTIAPAQCNLEYTEPTLPTLKVS